MHLFFNVHPEWAWIFLNWHQNDANSWHQLTINHRSKMKVLVMSTVNIKLMSTVGIKFMWHIGIKTFLFQPKRFFKQDLCVSDLERLCIKPHSILAAQDKLRDNNSLTWVILRQLKLLDHLGNACLHLLHSKMLANAVSEMGFKTLCYNKVHS